MQNQTVRLVTPFASDDSHPTGEWILETSAFTSASDLEKQIRRMIEEYMPEKPDLDKRIRPSFDFCLREKENKVRAFTGNSASVLLDAPMEQAALDIMTAALKEQRYTGREILNLMSEKTDIIQSYLLLLMLWQNGLTCRLP